MKNRRILYGIIMLVIVLLGIKLINTNYTRITEDNNLKNKIEDIVETKKGSNQDVIIEFEKITDFNWDKLYILNPYTDIENYAKEHNIEGIKNIRTNIDIDDGISLLLFVLDDKVVSYIDYSRNKGDFAYSDIKNSNGFTSQEANFKVMDNDGWLEIVNIK